MGNVPGCQCGDNDQGRNEAHIIEPSNGMRHAGVTSAANQPTYEQDMVQLDPQEGHYEARQANEPNKYAWDPEQNQQKAQEPGMRDSYKNSYANEQPNQ